MSKFEGVPEGFEFVGIRRAVTGDWHITLVGTLRQWKGPDSDSVYAILRKIETPKQYRPFASKAEFAPHRDRWVVLRFDKDNHECYLWLVTGYSGEGVYVGGGGGSKSDFVFYDTLLSMYVFDNLDGTFEPCGVEVTE